LGLIVNLPKKVPKKLFRAAQRRMESTKSTITQLMSYHCAEKKMQAATPTKKRQATLRMAGGAGMEKQAMYSGWKTTSLS
jgi:hypothetical protein